MTKPAEGFSHFFFKKDNNKLSEIFNFTQIIIINRSLLIIN